MDDTFSRIVGFGFATFIFFWIAYSYYQMAKTAGSSNKSEHITAPGCLSYLFGGRYDASPSEKMWGFLVLGLFALLVLILTIARSG